MIAKPVVSSRQSSMWRSKQPAVGSKTRSRRYGKSNSCKTQLFINANLMRYGANWAATNVRFWKDLEAALRLEA